MYFVFNILVLILVKTFISVGSNTTTYPKDSNNQNLRTTSSDILNAIADNDTNDLAIETTNWSGIRLATETPTTLYVIQRKTTISDIDSTERYTQTDNINNERVTQTETKSYGRPVTMTSPSMAAVYEETSAESEEKSDGMQRHESVTTKSLFTKHSDNSIFMGNKGPDSFEHICDFCLYEGQGNFTSYGYPLHYRNNLNCTYRVMRMDDSDVCEVELYFHDFDIPVSSLPSTAFQSTKNIKHNDCREDYIEVNDRKYCGPEWRHHSEILSFPLPQKELVFRFVSNEKTNGRGFWAEIRGRPNTCYGTRLKTQASEVCEERFSALEFEILSPHFPDNYPINSDCSYYIRRANTDVCALELLFYKFDTEYSEGCAYDYLEIDGQKFCGTIADNTQNIVKFESDQKMLSFQSDSQVSKSGFHIHVKQLTDCRTPSLPAPPSCNVCSSAGFGALVSYSYPDYYRNNLFCTYTIDRRNADYCYVELDFEDFELQDSPNCEADFLQVEDQRFCGESLKMAKRVIPFDGKEKGVVLLFKTDESQTKRGFLIQYKQLECTNDVVQEKASLPHSAVLPVPHSKCDYVFTDKEFVIKSENFSKSYANNLECSYYIKRNSSKVCYLELTFHKFDVEASPECQYDYLEVGNTVRLCGTLQTETVRTYIFDGNEKLLKFHSDASNNRNGFLIKAEQLECMGDKIIRKITPTLTTPSASVVSPTHHSLGDSSYCSQVIDQQEFNIFSPGYPNPYPANQDCLHMIRKVSPNVCKLEVIFDDFEIQPTDPNAYCKYDFLDFNGIRVCGTVIKGEVRTYLFPSESFPIHFHSDNSVTNSDRAFRINIRQTECDANQIPIEETTNKNPFQKTDRIHCNRVISEPVFELRSPNYPNNYPDNLNCKYTILKHRTGANICHLEVNFVDMNLEKSEDCSRDYLNFNGQLMCGSLSTETTRLYAFDSNQFEINFVSDHYGNERGFHLRLRQRDCPPEEQTHVIQQPFGNGLTQCGGIFSEESVDLKSPNYPHFYESNVDCVYTIRRKHNDICKLELTFEDFDVEPSPGCAYDYLMVDGKKLCGDLNRNHIKTLDFHEKEKTLLFRSGTYSVSNRRGFSVRAHQKDCELIAPNHDILATLPPIPSICEICFTEVMGSIQSYDFPNNYPANLNCKYKITALPGNCMVQLNFDQFRLEHSERCDSDYLEINNIRYCGNQLEGATLLAFNKKPEEVLIRFVTNGHKSFRGFRASYTQLPCIGGVPSGQQQITLQQQQQHYSHQSQPQLQRQPQHQKTPPTSPPSVSHYGSIPIAIVDTKGVNSSIIRIPCDRVIYDTVFEIRSPNYPAYYPSNADCLYSIRRANSDVCKLQLRFIYFDVKGSGDYKQCSGDSLEIDGTKLCGRLPNNTIKEIPFESYKTSLRFVSDASINAKGFEIIGRQIQCTFDSKSPPIKTYSNQSKHYSSHIPSQYGQSSVQYSNENTLTSSQSQPIPQPHSPFSYSSSHSPQSQQSVPYVSPHSSPSSQATPQQHVYHSRSPQPSPQSSPSETYKGQAYPSQKTDYSYERGSERHISSSPSPTPVKSYPTQQISSYHSRYQYSQQSQRPHSPSQIVHSSSQSQPYRPSQTYYPKTSQSYGSSEVSEGTQQRPYYPKPPQSPSHTEVRQKPKPNYGTQKKSKCDETIDKMYFEIKSPKEFNAECLYRIEKAKDNVCQIDIMFSNFDLGDQSCLNEYMAINGQRMCGTIDRNTMKTFKFEGNELMIELRTETMSFDKGFDIKARQVECSPPSGFTQTSSQSTTQRNYGQPSSGGSYNKIPKEKPHRSETPSHTFRPMHPPQQIGTNENSIREPPPQNFQQKPYPKPIESDQRFAPNFDGFDTRSPPAFDRNDQKVGPTSEERCHLIYNDIEFPIKSPNYPNHYLPNMFCRYTVRKATPNVCAIDMKFNSFDIEEDPKCGKDYLEVDAGRICGPLPPSHERRYYFLPEEYEKVLIFKSDDSGEKSGFSLLVRQVEDCTKPWEPMSAPTHPTVCDVCHHNLRGQISSTNYPNRYNDFTRCSYRIQAMSPQYCQVKLYLRDMDIEVSPSGQCMKDALIIDSEKLCGKDSKTKEMTLTFPSSEPREVIINFQTDVSGTGRGFLIEYVQESCSTSSNRSPSSGQPPSPFQTNNNQIGSRHSIQTLPTKPDNRFGTLLPPIYPPNYVSRAHIEEIVQTQVQVFDRNQTQQKSDIPFIK